MTAEDIYDLLVSKIEDHKKKSAQQNGEGGGGEASSAGPLHGKPMDLHLDPDDLELRPLERRKYQAKKRDRD